MSESSHIMVLNTCPDRETAEKLASSIVAEKLAACVNIIPGLTSVYQWQGKIENEQEVLLLIKTTKKVYNALQDRVCQLHPYELPEVIAVPIETGLPEYLDWIDQSLEQQND